MSTENINGIPDGIHAQGKAEGGFQFRPDKEASTQAHIDEYRKMKAEVAALIRQQDEGKALREKLGNAELNKAGEEIEAELGRKIALAREDMKTMEIIMDRKGIQPEEYRDQ